MINNNNTLENNIFKTIMDYYPNEEFIIEHADLIIQKTKEIENIINIDIHKKKIIAVKRWNDFINCMNEKIICALCLDEKEKANFIETNCGHKFCDSCSHTQGFLNLKSCPLCRQPINFSESPQFLDLEEYHSRQDYLQLDSNPAPSTELINHIHNNTFFYNNPYISDNTINNNFIANFKPDTIMALGSLYQYFGGEETFEIDTPNKINIKNELHTIFNYIDEEKNKTYTKYSNYHYYKNDDDLYQQIPSVKTFNENQKELNRFYCCKRHSLNKTNALLNIHPDDITQLAMFKNAVLNFYDDIITKIRYCINDDDTTEISHRIILWILQCYRAVLYKVKMNLQGIQHFNIPDDYIGQPLFILPNKSYKAEIKKTKIFSITFNGYTDCYDNRFTMKIVSIRNENHKLIKQRAEQYHEVTNPQVKEDYNNNWSLNDYDENYTFGSIPLLTKFEKHFDYIYEDGDIQEGYLTDKFFNENIFNTIDYFNENPVSQF